MHSLQRIAVPHSNTEERATVPGTEAAGRCRQPQKRTLLCHYYHEKLLSLTLDSIATP